MNTALQVMPSLMNSVPAGLLIAGLCWLMLRFLRAANAATRYSIWFVALMAVSVMPLAIGRRAVPVPSRHEVIFAGEHAPAFPEGVRTEIVVDPAMEIAADRVPAEASRDPLRFSPSSLTLGIDLGVALFSGWLAGVAFMLGRLALSALRTVTLRRSSVPFDSEVEGRLPSVAPARLAISPNITSPITIGFRKPVILIPAALAGRITERDLEFIALHESAHVLRGDAWTNLAQRLVEALLFFHPAVWFIGRRLNLEREIACDDWTIARTRQHKHYAECLTRLIELGGWSPQPALATGVLHFPRQISRRIEMILNQKRNRVPVTNKFAALFAGALAIGGVALFSHASRLVAAEDPKAVPVQKPASGPRVLPEQRFERVAPRNVRVVQSDRGGRREMEVSWSSGWDRLSIRTKGEIDFTDDDRDIRSIEPYGYFRVEERSWFFLQRRIEVAADHSGILTRTYEVQGDQKPFDSQAKGWMGAMLSTMVRDLGAGAESRVRRIFAQRGVGGVLDEISRIRPDGVKCTYFRHLIDLTGPGHADLDRILRRVAREIGSDGDKSRLLHDVSEDALTAAAPRAAFFEAVQTIGSDGDRSRLLHEVLTEGVRPPETLALVLKSAARIGSDGDKSRVLTELTTLHPIDDTLRPAFFRAVATIGSDGDRARVLSATMKESSSYKETMVEVLKAIGRIGSDGDKARLLVQTTELYTKDDALRVPFFLSVSTIGSDGDRHRVLAALLHRGGISRETMLDLLRAATRLGSDGEKSRLLVEFTRVCPTDEALLSAVLDAAASIGSDGDYRRVVSALAERSGGKSAIAKKAKAD